MNIGRSREYSFYFHESLQPRVSLRGGFLSSDMIPVGSRVTDGVECKRMRVGSRAVFTGDERTDEKILGAVDFGNILKELGATMEQHRREYPEYGRRPAYVYKILVCITDIGSKAGVDKMESAVIYWGYPPVGTVACG